MEKEKKVIVKKVNEGFEVVEKIKKTLLNSGQTLEFWVKFSTIKFTTLDEVAEFLETLNEKEGLK